MSAKRAAKAERAAAKAAQKRGSALLLEEFIALGYDLGLAVQELFPECLATRKAVAFFEASRGVGDTEQEIVEGWHACMREHYAVIARGDLSTIEHVKSGPAYDMGIADKLGRPDFDSESREALLQYLQGLNRLAMAYLEPGAAMPGAVAERPAVVSADPPSSASAPVEGDTAGLGARGEALVQRFAAVALDLAQHVQTTYPLCEGAARGVAYYRTIVGNADAEIALTRAWHAAMRDLSDDITRGDVSGVSSVDAVEVASLALAGKMGNRAFAASTVEHLQALCLLARCYCAVPPKVMAAIASLTGEMSAMMSKGHFSKADYDRLGKRVAARAPEGDIEDFMLHLPDILAATKLLGADEAAFGVPV